MTIRQPEGCGHAENMRLPRAESIAAGLAAGFGRTASTAAHGAVIYGGTSVGPEGGTPTGSCAGPGPGSVGGTSGCTLGGGTSTGVLGRAGFGAGSRGADGFGFARGIADLRAFNHRASTVVPGGAHGLSLGAGTANGRMMRSSNAGHEAPHRRRRECRLRTGRGQELDLGGGRRNSAIGPGVVPASDAEQEYSECATTVSTT
jgi:hypothetical protein